jgi:hypothetical protein
MNRYERLGELMDRRVVDAEARRRPECSGVIVRSDSRPEAMAAVFAALA